MMFAPREELPPSGVMPNTKPEAKMAPMTWATMLHRPWMRDRLPERKRARVTAGLNCPPEMWPRE